MCIFINHRAVAQIYMYVSDALDLVIFSGEKWVSQWMHTINDGLTALQKQEAAAKGASPPAPPFDSYATTLRRQLDLGKQVMGAHANSKALHLKVPLHLDHHTHCHLDLPSRS